MIAENLAKLRKQIQLSQKEFAVKLNINPLTYVNYERGDRKPPYEILIKLFSEYNVNLNWLIADKGEMFNNTQQFNAEKDNLRKEVLQILKDEGVIK